MQILKGKQATDYHPEVPYFQMPKIIGSFISEGVKYYIGADNKKYIAERFDAFFRGIKMSVNPNKFHKGDLIGKGAAWQ